MLNNTQSYYVGVCLIKHNAKHTLSSVYTSPLTIYIEVGTIFHMSDSICFDGTSRGGIQPPKIVRIGDARIERIDWVECAQLYQSGILGPALAARYEIDVRTIYRHLRRMGVMRDHRGEARVIADKAMFGLGLTPKAILKAVQEAGGDEELGKDDALVENRAKTLVFVESRQQRVLGAMMTAVEVMVMRMADADYTKTVKTKTGLVVLISASEEVKNCANALKTIIPLERIVHGMGAGDADAAARKAEDSAKKSSAAMQQVLDIVKQQQRIAKGEESRLGRAK